EGLFLDLTDAVLVERIGDGPGKGLACGERELELRATPMALDETLQLCSRGEKNGAEAVRFPDLGSAAHVSFENRDVHRIFADEGRDSDGGFRLTIAIDA